MHAELSFRTTDAPDRMLAAVDGIAGQGVDGGQPGDLVATLHTDALPAKCGDELVLRATIVSASTPYLELLVTLTLP